MQCDLLVAKVYEPGGWPVRRDMKICTLPGTETTVGDLFVAVRKMFDGDREMAYIRETDYTIVQTQPDNRPVQFALLYAPLERMIDLYTAKMKFTVATTGEPAAAPRIPTTPPIEGVEVIVYLPNQNAPDTDSPKVIADFNILGELLGYDPVYKSLIDLRSFREYTHDDDSPKFGTEFGSVMHPARVRTVKWPDEVGVRKRPGLAVYKERAAAAAAEKQRARAEQKKRAAEAEAQKRQEQVEEKKRAKKAAAERRRAARTAAQDDEATVRKRQELAEEKRRAAEAEAQKKQELVELQKKAAKIAENIAKGWRELAESEEDGAAADGALEQTELQKRATEIANGIDEDRRKFARVAETDADINRQLRRMRLESAGGGSFHDASMATPLSFPIPYGDDIGLFYSDVETELVRSDDEH
jgi:hypothetical protein